MSEMLNNVSFENLVSYLMVDAKILFVVICRFLVPQLYQEKWARDQEEWAKQKEA